MLATEWGVGWTSVQRLTPSPPPIPQAAGEGFYRGGLHAETVSSDSHLQIGHQCSDEHHLGCFRCSSSLVPGSVCFHFFEASSQNCGSFCHGYSLVLMQLASLPNESFSIYKRTHKMWLRILSI